MGISVINSNGFRLGENKFQSAKPREPTGFSLVEVIVALAVFSMMSLGFTASLIRSLKLSDLVLSRSSAHSIALGYSEQIMAHSYDEMSQALGGDGRFTLYSTSLGSSNVAAIADVFTFGVESEKLIILDIDRQSQLATRTMPIRFTFNAQSLYVGADSHRALEISINYRYLPSGADKSNDDVWKEETVHLVKSLVDIY